MAFSMEFQVAYSGIGRPRSEGVLLLVISARDGSSIGKSGLDPGK